MSGAVLGVLGVLLCTPGGAHVPGGGRQKHTTLERVDIKKKKIYILSFKVEENMVVHISFKLAL